MLRNRFLKSTRFYALLVTVALSLSACNRTTKNYQNRLGSAGSPYLREHADNPVDWHEWSSETLEQAVRQNKPLIISIGYSSCHWCHVMEKESFMDTAVANLMNREFVCIKVDREERPDVDQVYIQAAQVISRDTGWPMNAFALPDGRPFYTTTYAPKERWLDILTQVSRAYREENENIVKQADAITRGVKSINFWQAETNKESDLKDLYESVAPAWVSMFDATEGGLSGAPKFPLPVIWESLLQNHYLTGNKQALTQVTTTLDKMLMGGIYDQVGGGFARYATDEKWRVPHFEKMLYDNAQLVSLYAHAYQQTGNSSYLKVVRETLAFIASDLMAREGGFYSSLDADSEGEEGKFYVWRKSEIEKLLDEKSAKIVNDYFNVTDSGNWNDGKNILFRAITDADFAAAHQESLQQLILRLAHARDVLLKARNQRAKPFRDEKILTAWNAMMLNGYVDAYFAVGEPQYLEVALKNAAFIEKQMLRPDGRLFRSSINGKSSIDGFLDDYTFTAKAFMRLYEATFDKHWLEISKKLIDYAIAHFRDNANGVFFYTSDEVSALAARTIEMTDNVVPSSNSVMTDVLLRAGIYFDDDTYRQMGDNLLMKVASVQIKSEPWFANWFMALGRSAYLPFEVAVTGPDAVAKSKELMKHYLPTTILMGGLTENLPLLEGKLVKDKTIIYVCRNRVCKLPTQETAQALSQLGIRE